MNQQLARYMRERPTPPAQMPTPDASSLPYRGRRWQVRDRLDAHTIAAIVAAFKAGTAKHVLAKRYGIAERSLKKLLCEEGVKSKSWKDIQAPDTTV